MQQLEDPLIKLANKVAEKLGIPVERVKLLFDGEVLKLDATAAQYDLEDEDMVDASIR